MFLPLEMNRRSGSRLCALVSVCLLSACAVTTEDETDAPGCDPGMERACTGAQACAGTQVCRDDGAGFLPCVCQGAGATDGGADSSDGDGSADDAASNVDAEIDDASWEGDGAGSFDANDDSQTAFDGSSELDGSVGSSCAACLQQYCAGELTDCYSNPECVALGLCIENCATPACEIQCEQAQPTAVPFHDALVLCTYNKCSLECALN